MLHTTPGVESRSFRASPWGAEFVEPSAFSRWGFPLVLGLICLLLLSAYTPLQAEFTIQPFFNSCSNGVSFAKRITFSTCLLRLRPTLFVSFSSQVFMGANISLTVFTEVCRWSGCIPA